MKETIVVSDNFPVIPEKLYNAWLSSKEHTSFTGDMAEVSKVLNKIFTAGNGYISGKNLILEPYKRIVQSWRATDFPDKHPDSFIELTFEPKKTGTKLTLKHSGIPEGMGKDYKKGWKEFYFEPMKEYFSK
jgi:activator of HSP90 ATPase